MDHTRVMLLLEFQKKNLGVNFLSWAIILSMNFQKKSLRQISSINLQILKKEQETIPWPWSPLNLFTKYHFILILSKFWTNFSWLTKGGPELLKNHNFGNIIPNLGKLENNWMLRKVIPQLKMNSWSIPNS